MPDPIAKVVKVRSSLAVGGNGRIDADIVHQLLDTGLAAFFDDADYTDRLGGLLRDDDTVGLKVNTLGGRGMSTNPQLIALFSDILTDSGLRPKNRIIWDRSDRELKGVGYDIDVRGNSICFGTDHKGIGYGRELVAHGNIGSLFSRIQTDYCSGMISFPILKDHGIAGITCALKNYFGAIHNPNKYHDNHCDPYIADLNELEQIRAKQRLIIVDCLKVQYHGGPSYQPAWAADYGGLLIGTDPVAIDTIALGIIEQLRAIGGKEPLKGSKREPIYIKTAQDRGIGTGDIERIDLREISI